MGILHEKEKIFFWLKNGKYSWKDYWEKRGKDFIKESYQVGIYDQHYWILEKIKLYKPKNILEIGCGFWRNIKFIKDNYSKDIHITWIDISESLIVEATQFLKDYQDITLYQSDILSLDANVHYDMILIHGVFMHIPTQEFLLNRKHLLSLSYNSILEVEEVQLGQGNKILNKNINGFTFSHNYLHWNENIREHVIKNDLIYLDISKDV